VTSGGTAEVSHGLAEFVAQEEMGRFSGYWWSPDARFIAYEEADATGVEAWHVADPARPEQPALPSYYPRPGKTNVRVRLGVVPVSGGPTTWIDWDAQRYPYLAAVQWEKKAPLTLTVQTRDQKELALLQADPVTRKTAVLLTESDPAWVNLNPGMPKWLEDGSGFLWTSEQGGGPRLELRSRDGALVRVLVPPEAGFHRLVDVDLEAKRVVYNASVDPTQEQLFRISLDGGSAVALTHEPGLHRADFARNHAIYVYYRRCLSEAPRVEVRRADGTRIGELPSLAETPPFVPNVKLVRVGRGRGFHAALVRPRAFDPRKRYPVLVDVYGGPRGNTVWATMGAWLLDQWLADQGFVVVSVDGRGTARRGRDWERAISRRFGSVPLNDQIAGLKALGQRFPELDLDRVGIVGWSFGGYMAALAVLKRPDIFKAAVAGAPVADWLDYDTHYTERYLGMPDTDAAAYKEASLLSYASRLRRPLLLIHGTADDNVFFRHTLKLADALFRAGREFELLPLSSSTHMTPDPVVTERLWSRIALHFRRHLGRPRAQPAASARGKRGSGTTVR
jgi:dipeptidyl-peptidase 4